MFHSPLSISTISSFFSIVFFLFAFLPTCNISAHLLCFSLFVLNPISASKRAIKTKVAHSKTHTPRLANTKTPFASILEGKIIHNLKLFYQKNGQCPYCNPQLEPKKKNLRAARKQERKKEQNFIYLWNAPTILASDLLVVELFFFGLVWFLFSRLVYFCLHLSKYWRYTYCFAFSSLSIKISGTRPSKSKNQTKEKSKNYLAVEFTSMCVCECVYMRKYAVTFTLLTGVCRLSLRQPIPFPLYLRCLLLKLLLRYA